MYYSYGVIDTAKFSSQYQRRTASAFFHCAYRDQPHLPIHFASSHPYILKKCLEGGTYPIRSFSVIEIVYASVDVFFPDYVHILAYETLDDLHRYHHLYLSLSKTSGTINKAFLVPASANIISKQPSF